MKHTSCTVEQRARVRAALRVLARRYRTQGELARALGVRQQTVSGVLSGAAHPGLFLAMKIARFVRVPLEVLLSQGWNADSKAARVTGD